MTVSTKLVSIITPTYNRALLLPRMVESVLQQIYKDWELIIMDDGSTDSTAQVVGGYKDSRIRFFHNENSGASHKRNKGVEKAKGDFIIFLDSDDSVQDNWLELLVEKIGNKSDVIITCGLKKFNEDHEELSKEMPKDLGPMFNHLKLNYLSGTMLFPKKYFQAINGYDTKLTSGQHTELLIRLLPLIQKHQTPIKIVNQALVNIYVHKGDRIRHNYEGIYQGSTRTMKKHSKLFEKNPKKYFDYTSVAAVCGFRAGRIEEVKKLTKKGIGIRPFYYKAYIRYIIAHIPILRKRIWHK